MEEGGAVSAGRRRSRAASTARRSSSKNGGSFIAAGNGSPAGCRGASRFGLPLRVERLCRKLAIGSLQEDFHSALRSGGRIFPRGRRREENVPTLRTTTPDRESWAPDADSILKHAREQTQLLCASGAPPAVSTCWRGGEGRGEPATAIRKSRCCRYQRPAIDPARSPSTDAWTRRAMRQSSGG